MVIEHTINNRLSCGTACSPIGVGISLNSEIFEVLIGDYCLLRQYRQRKPKEL